MPEMTPEERARKFAFWQQSEDIRSSPIQIYPPRIKWENPRSVPSNDYQSVVDHLAMEFRIAEAPLRAEIERLRAALEIAVTPVTHLSGCLSRESRGLPCQCGWSDRLNAGMAQMKSALAGSSSALTERDTRMKREGAREALEIAFLAANDRIRALQQRSGSREPAAIRWWEEFADWLRERAKKLEA